MNKLYNLTNGDYILKEEYRNKIIDILNTNYAPGAGTAIYHAIKYVMAFGIPMHIAANIINSIK